MSRHLCGAMLPLAILAGMAWAQDDPADPGPPAVVALLEDDTEFLIANLTNPGVPDASVAERNEETVFSGVSALTVTEFQRFHPQLPNWSYKIVENPGPGEYRFLRFAWKRTEAPGIMLQLHAGGNWHRYYAGTLSKETQSWKGPMTRVAEQPPRQWEVVTRDLFQDFGPITITGLGLSALEGPGHAYFDHMYLGRTIEDLDRITAAKQAISDPPAPASGETRFIIPVLAIAGVIAASLLLLFAWSRRKPRQTAQAGGGSATERLIAFSCSECGKQFKVKETMAGKRTKCPGCGHALVVP